MSNVRHGSIVASVLCTVLVADLCINEVSTKNDPLISENLNRVLQDLNCSLHVKYLTGLILEVDVISGFSIFWLRYPGRFENYLELQFSKAGNGSSRTIGDQGDEISATLRNCTQMDRCQEVSCSRAMKLKASNQVRVWITFHGSFKVGQGVDCLSFRFLLFDPPSFLDFISYVSFGNSSASLSALRIYRTPFINKCILLANESEVARRCGNELTDEAACVSCGCCFNPVILPTMPCFKPIGMFDFVDYDKCDVPISKITEDIQFLNTSPTCVDVDVRFILASKKSSYNILKLSFDFDFGDGLLLPSQRFLKLNDSHPQLATRSYVWQSNHSYSKPGLYEALVKYKNEINSVEMVIARTEVSVERALLQPLPTAQFHVIADRPALVGDSVNILLLIQLRSQPLSVLASVNGNKIEDKIVMMKSSGYPEWLEDSLDEELESLGPTYQGVLKSMTNSSGNDPDKSIYQGLFRRVFMKPGEYSIRFAVTSVCGSAEVSRTLNVHKGSNISFVGFVGMVDIVTNGSVAVQEEVGIVVSMQHVTKNTYVLINLGDGSAVLTLLPVRRLPLPPWAVQKFGWRPAYSSVSVSHRYTVAGKFRVQAMIKDVVWNQHFTKIVEVEVTCFANVTFPGLASPTRHPINEPLFVRREITQNCTSADPDEEWKLYQGTSKSSLLPLPVNVEIRPLFGLVVPPYTLVPAVYTVEIKVLIPLSKDSGHKTISDELQVEFVSVGILINIRAPDTHTLAFDSTLILDASNSRDLDDPARSARGLSFTWFCSTQDDFSQTDPLSTIEGTSCNEARPTRLPFTAGAIRYRTGQLFSEVEVRKIWFHVHVTKPGRRPGNATHAVRLLRSYDAPLGISEIQPRKEDRQTEAFDNLNPHVVITCIQNCNATIDPRQELELGVLCVNCHMSDVLTYQWSLITHGNASSDDDVRPKIDLEAVAKFSTDKSDVIVEAGAFEDIDSPEKCIISVKVTFPTRQEVTVSYGFSIKSSDNTSYVANDYTLEP